MKPSDIDTRYDYYTWVDHKPDYSGETKLIGVVHPTRHGRFSTVQQAREAMSLYLEHANKVLNERIDNSYYAELASNNNATE